MCFVSQKGKKQGKWGGKRRTAGKSIILVETKESKQMDGFKSCGEEIKAIPGLFYNDLL